MSVERYTTGGPWESLYGYARAVKAGPWIVTAGCTATVQGDVRCVGDPGGQTKEAFRIALDAIVDAGASVGDVVRTRMYITDPMHADAVGRAHGELFGVVKPAATVVVTRLLHPEQLVQVEVEAYLPDEDLNALADSPLEGLL
ncbi:RidA family protein [Longispora sp. NPDC051575]|uniref:RidA family protein n=1 Tax=Longispora sp. NPDC051575 TaxID=3154943 RepID=UPI0034430DC3